MARPLQQMTCDEHKGAGKAGMISRWWRRRAAVGRCILSMGLRRPGPPYLLFWQCIGWLPPL